ncbi:hypothetical protein PC116_g4444 [Phytophthora cactorum]|uniref:Uncharacterized protein n=1 Tax=Phytophthora cactorum TaxID=29920 RepID=A0A8T1EJI8_9STRA|nr:hypothetical protein Pcac1_g14375 [Phytophthora cactorum]KAG2910021.1 hypothetical protein PC114_g9888 [Phytophthora cactorum]KAG2951767.1 hypothetical protein PC117_g3354 [Phytophthora cactorum]KAG3018489.1 hypothetical protein PC120_g10402 [Phytophthora cactorum]KAG3022292.1 hypothetical protein PC119_g9311 [Phytophthora cactorum]
MSGNPVAPFVREFIDIFSNKVPVFRLAAQFGT